ncbi:MAG: ComF family protein [Candidatus Moranbacteria bacterium]|nr:ComF family protein [Candidatus Moranbacteria bacterium]
MKKIIGKIKKTVLDTLFPIACLGCQKNDFWICGECFQKIPIRRDQVCPACERETTLSGFLCRACRTSQKLHLDALISAVSYKNQTVKKMIHNFKYRFAISLSEPLARLEIKALLSQNVPLPSAIIPVPLHPRRLRWRGFNQAQLLAENISQNLAPPFKITVLNLLERKKYNKPQMELENYHDRLQNVRDLFAIRPGISLEKIKGKIVYLVDDIATTGATLEECAKILKRAGAKKVFAVVIARQTLKK